MTEGELTMRKLLAFCFALLLFGTALAESAEPAWTSKLPALTAREAAMLVPANTAEPLAEDYVPKNLINVIRRRDGDDGRNANGGVYVSTNGNVQLVSEAAAALTKLMQAAEADGITLYLRQGYRSYQDQAKLVKRARITDLVQPAGACDYQTGLAVTLVGYDWRGRTLNAEFAATREAQWLEANAPVYGFVLRYPKGKEGVTGNAYEPWHLRYVGSSKVAGSMVRANLCLEEYLERYRADLADFEARGGDLEALIAATTLPAGPVILDAAGPDGDHELVLFHD